MLASYPASILNQKTRRAGILKAIPLHTITLQSGTDRTIAANGNYDPDVFESRFQVAATSERGHSRATLSRSSGHNLHLYRPRALGGGGNHQIATWHISTSFDDLTDGSDRVHDRGAGRIGREAR